MMGLSSGNFVCNAEGMADGMRRHGKRLEILLTNPKGLLGSWPWKIRSQKVRSQPQSHSPQTRTAHQPKLPRQYAPFHKMLPTRISRTVVSSSMLMQSSLERSRRQAFSITMCVTVGNKSDWKEDGFGESRAMSNWPRTRILSLVASSRPKAARRSSIACGAFWRSVLL